MKNNKLIIYQTEDGKVKIETHFKNETVWLNIDQIAELFQKSRSTINEHILNIYNEQELEQELSIRKVGNSDFSARVVCRNFRHTTQHGAIVDKAQTNDVIISADYRVKSQQGTHLLCFDA